MSGLQERLASLQGVPNVVPRFEVSQSDSNVSVIVWCPDGQGQPRVQAEGRAFGFVLEPYYLPLFLPDTVTSEIDVQQSSDGAWNLVLKKQVARPFVGLDSLQPEILPPEGIEAIAQAESQANAEPSPQAGTSVGTGEDQEAVQSVLARALQSENTKRTAQHQPGLVLTSDEEMRPVDAHRDAEDKLLRALRKEAVSSSSTTSAIPIATFKDGPRYGYGLGLAFDDPFPQQLVQLTKVYELQAADPSSLPLEQRDGMATADENKKWDEDYYLNCMVDKDGEIASLLQCELRPPEPEEGISVSASPPALPVPDAPGDEAWRMLIEYESLLISLLFAYAYDRRTTMNDPTVQSAWTIAQLCRPLVYFAPAAGPVISSPPSTTIPPVLLEHPLIPCLLASFRRSLSIPLHRSYVLSSVVLQDVLDILRNGLSSVAAALETIRSLFIAAAGSDDAEEDNSTVLPDQDPFLLVYVRVALEPLLGLLLSSGTPELVVRAEADLSRQLQDSDWDPRKNLFKDQVGGLQQWGLVDLDEVVEA